ncbi:hypothetical protein Tco_0818707 [Tanacetum coccineum]
MPTDNMYLCARNNLGKTVSLLKEIFKEKTEQVQQMIKDQAKEYYENRATMQKKEELWQSEKSLLVKDLTDALKIIDQLKIEQIRLEEQKDEEIRKLKTQLSMKGGIQIEGDEITIYKKVTRIKTSNQTEVAEIAELENGELCKLDIINPDITIEDRPLKHVTSVMEDSFKKHVDNLHRIGAIRPSKSRHQTMAMILNLGTTIDPVTGKGIKGKERMVFNYKSLNDNTYKDQYSLPGINMIIKRVGGAKIFSKFDLKSGFHQVAMDE